MKATTAFFDKGTWIKGKYTLITEKNRACIPYTGSSASVFASNITFLHLILFHLDARRGRWNRNAPCLYMSAMKVVGHTPCKTCSNELPFRETDHGFWYRFCFRGKFKCSARACALFQIFWHDVAISESTDYPLFYLSFVVVILWASVPCSAFASKGEKREFVKLVVSICTKDSLTEAR